MFRKGAFLGRCGWGALLWAQIAAATPAEDLVQEGKEELEKGAYVKASEAFRKAEKLAYDDPSEGVALAIKKGLALADAGLLRAAVETQTKTAGNDLKALVELHRLHLRLRSIGGDKAIAADIERAMNIRASLVLSEYEKDSVVRDIQPLLELGRYPELGESIQKRLQVVTAKPWRVYDARATATKDPLVAQVFRGAAAKISGDAITSRTGEIDKLLLPYRRASEITVNATGACAPLVEAAKQAGLRGGSLQVDANVTIDACTESSRSETKRVTENYTVSIPYQTEEDVAVQVCSEVKVPVSYCINPYTKDGCVGSSDTTTQYRCSTSMQRQVVTRYREEPRTREVDRTFVYSMRSATLKWKRSYAGQVTEQAANLTATLVNGTGTPLGQLITNRLRENLEEAVSNVISERAITLRSEGDKALASGNLDQAESSYLQAILLGRSAGDYFVRTCALSDAALRETLNARPAGKPLHQLTKVEPLPAITDEQGDKVLTLLRDRFAAQFPPAMSRVKGFWYAADLGAFSVPTQTTAVGPAGGGFSAMFGINLGMPLLSRIHGRTGGFAFWDDIAIGGNLGYTLTEPASGKRGIALRGLATYTLAAGVRLQKFQLLAGARASGRVMRVAETDGKTGAISIYGNIGAGLGSIPSLTLEGWWSLPVGLRSRGLQLSFTAPTSQSQYKGQIQGGAAGNITSYFSLRVEDELYDGCLGSVGGCVASGNIQVITGAVSFGAAFL